MVELFSVESAAVDHSPPSKRFITSGDTLFCKLLPDFDQSAYRLHYASKWDNLPPEYNWKPCWGVNEDARIVHFHGPKIPQVRTMLTGKDTLGIPKSWINLFRSKPESYRDYLARFERYESQ